MCLTRSRRVCYRINPLNADLNPVCHLLALLGAHHILHVSRIRGNAIHELPSPLVLLLLWQTCITILNFHSSMNFDGHYLKNGWQSAVLFWGMLQAGPPYLQNYCAVVLHSCIVLPPLGHSSNHEYHCCQLTRQSNCVSNFYRTFKVLMSLYLVYPLFYSLSLRL
jgi:hypothetical protein